MPVVIKADGRREPFDRNKIEHGIHAAVAKRPVSRDQVSALALDVEREIGELNLSEITARDVGERVLPKLKALDQVAYVRFASIYRDFRDLDGFEKELEAMRLEDTGEGAPLADSTDEHPPVAVGSSSDCPEPRRRRLHAPRAAARRTSTRAARRRTRWSAA